MLKPLCAGAALLLLLQVLAKLWRHRNRPIPLNRQPTPVPPWVVPVPTGEQARTPNTHRRSATWCTT